MVKDNKYLRWRYQKCPSFRYQFVAVRDIRNRGKLIALAAVFIDDSSKSKKIGIISDMLLIKEESLAIYKLIACCINFFYRYGCNLCFSHALDSRLVPYFRRSGFKVEPSDLGLMVLLPKTGEEGLSGLLDPTKWSLWLGDTDRY